MSNKIVIVGDTHIGIRNDSLVFHGYFRKYYEWFFGQMKDRGINTMIQLGDWHDRKKYSNFNSLHLSEEYFFNPLIENGFTAYILAGNHDVSFKNTNKVNSLDTYLTKFSNIHVVTQDVETININGMNCDFYPWINEENYKTSIEYAKNSTSKYSFGHFEFNNFDMYRGHTCSEGMDHRLFKRYEKVFSGHYHTYSTKDNIIYTGTPYELNWSDYNDQKYVFILDLDTGEIEYLPTPYTMHVKLTYDDKNNNTTDLTAIDIKDKYVKIVVANKENFYDFDKYLSAVNHLGAAEVKVIEENIREMVESVEDESLCFDDTPTLMESYINSIEDLAEDRKLKLQSLMKQLYVEASNT